jgi:uncharacterized protein
MYINRVVENTILEISKSFPCVVIYGARQVGKSTTIDYLFGDKYKKVSLDDIEDRTLALSNPKLFLESNGWPLIIDEIQKAPKLIEEIKKIIDEQRLKWLKNKEDRTLMYILTGSNRFELQNGISDSLAGRCGIVDMFSFMQVEKEGYKFLPFSPKIADLKNKEKLCIKHKTKEEIYNDIFIGGMPDVFTGESQREIYFKSYVNTYIEKDILKLINASYELQFRNFLSIIALRTAQELHYDEIAGNVGINVETCKRWISILNTSGIIYLLTPYMANISKRIIKAPKLYFMDTGLCSYLCKWPNSVMLSNCAMNGAFFETYVVSEVIKNLNAFNIDVSSRLFYYRDIDQKEIDLLYIEGDEIYPIEIKKSNNPIKATKNFRVLEKYKKIINTGIILDACDKIRPINEFAYNVPIELI